MLIYVALTAFFLLNASFIALGVNGARYAKLLGLKWLGYARSALLFFMGLLFSTIFVVQTYGLIVNGVPANYSMGVISIVLLFGVMPVAIVAAFVDWLHLRNARAMSADELEALSRTKRKIERLMRVTRIAEKVETL